jgi:hypothetical protein
MLRVSPPLDGEGTLNQRQVKIIPVMVHRFDLAQLPPALAFLHPKRARAGFLQIVETAYQTSSLQPYFLVNPGTTPLRCSHARLARLSVTPM